MKTAGLILAAGSSSRLGRPKQLVKSHGKSLLEQAIETALKVPLDKVFVVLGARFDEIEPSVSHLPVTVIRNDHWQVGMGSSISAGMKAVMKESGYEAVLIMLCDQLHMTAQHLDMLCDAQQQKRGSIIATTYGEQTGVPALFGHEHFRELEKLSGETGAKKIILQHAGKLHSIRFEQAIIDIDTPEDLHKNGLT